MSQVSDEILSSPKWADQMMFSVDQVAEILGMGRGPVDLAIKRGEIPIVRIGKLIRIKRKTVRELIGE
jgi:excisionase family DNA binding protein